MRWRYCTVEANYRRMRSIARPLCDSRAFCHHSSPEQQLVRCCFWSLAFLTILVTLSLCRDVCNHDRLFGKITNNTQRLLYCLLPTPREQHYELRQRVQNFQLPTRSSSLLDTNYFIRMMPLSAQHDNRNFIDRMLFRQAHSVSV